MHEQYIKNAGVTFINKNKITEKIRKYLTNNQQNKKDKSIRKKKEILPL